MKIRIMIAMLFVAGFARPQTLHWINLADLGIPEDEIPAAVATIERELGDELQHVTKALDFQLRPHMLRYPAIGKAGIQDLFNGLYIRSDDIVVVSVLTHGYNQEGNKPTLVLLKEKLQIPYEDILEILYRKQPAYILSIVNACNKPLETHPTPALPRYHPVWEPQLRLQVSDAAIRTLFAPTPYTVAVTFLSSQPGDFTYITNNGGFAFRAFLDAWRYWTDGTHDRDEIRWENVLVTAQAICINQTTGKPNIKVQCPFSEILNVKVDAQGKIQKGGESMSLCD